MWHPSAHEGRYRVTLELGDLDLRDVLAEALAGHPALALAEPGHRADLVITDRPDSRLFEEPALRLGAGPLPADAPPELILSAAHLLAAGLGILQVGEPIVSRPVPTLSSREREVLALLIEGAPNKAIARALDISVSTAKFHVAAVLTKLGARNRSEAVALALRDGLVTL